MAPPVVVRGVVPVVIVVVTASVIAGPPVAGGCCRRARAPAGLGIDEPLEFTAIEEDPTAFRALVYVHAVPFVLPHLAMALRTGQVAHAEPNGPCDSRVPRKAGRSLSFSNGL